MRQHILPSGMPLRPATPGCQNATALRRDRARRAGRRSGVVRRQLAELRRGEHTQKVAQVDTDAFERLYKAMCEREGLEFDRRGLNSTHALYRALMTRYRVKGNGYETTNAQTAAAMARGSRRRCTRTVQRLRKRLTAMGVIDFHHVKRSGWERRPGELDSLRVICLHHRCRRANVTLRSQSEPALKGRRLRRKALVPPPTAADGLERRFAAQGTEEVEAGTASEPSYVSEEQRRLEYLTMCEAYAPALLERGHRRRQELAALRSLLGSGHGTARTDSIAAEGER